MKILDELISQLTTDDFTEQVRELCDMISEEEKLSEEKLKIAPKGPNIFLTVEVPKQTSEDISFLTLERVLQNEYIARLWTKMGKLLTPRPLLVQRVWNIREDKPKKVLVEFAKIVKFLRGE
jgi:hypothetical protein